MTYATDPRRAILVNGAGKRRQMHRKEPDITLTQSLIAGVVVAVWTLGVLAVAVAVS